MDVNILHDEVQKNKLYIDKMNENFHALDKSMSLIQLETTAVKESINHIDKKIDKLSQYMDDMNHKVMPEIDRIKKNIDGIAKEVTQIKERHKIEDLDKTRKKKFWGFFLTHWRFLFAILGGAAMLYEFGKTLLYMKPPGT